MERAALTVLQSIPLIKPTSCSCVKGLAVTTRIVGALWKEGSAQEASNAFMGSMNAVEEDVRGGYRAATAIKQEPKQDFYQTKTRFQPASSPTVNQPPLRDPEAGSLSASEDIYLTRLMHM